MLILGQIFSYEKDESGAIYIERLSFSPSKYNANLSFLISVLGFLWRLGWKLLGNLHFICLMPSA